MRFFRFCSVVVCSIAILFSYSGTSQAYFSTDDMGVIDGMQYANSRDYINEYGYDYDLLTENYFSPDKIVWLEEYAGNINRITIVGEGYATDSGILVGMNASVLKSLYKNLSYSNNANQIANKYGVAQKLTTKMKFLGGHSVYVVQFVTKDHQALSFMIDKKSDEIIAIDWARNNQGTDNMIEHMKYLQMADSKN